MEILDKKSALIEIFEIVISSHKDDMTNIYILYNMSCHDNYTKLNLMQKYELMDFIHYVYMEDESQTDLGTLSDIAMDNFKKVLKGTFTRDDIYDFI